jgi:3-hydroxymyristoyl/3-hydroxydecanoyl-(acyl carrier protein) dehydratase
MKLGSAPPIHPMASVADIHIPPDHPAFAGHFPGTPIVPGVVLLDEALDVIAGALGLTLARCTLAAVKFKSVVRPGQLVTLRFEFMEPGSVRFELESEGQPVASGTLSVAAPDEQAHGR